MRPLAGTLVVLAALSGCGGGHQPSARTTKAPGRQAAQCARLEQMIRVRLGALEAGRLVGEFNAGCATTTAATPVAAPDDHPAFNRLLARFGEAAAHRVPDEAGSECHDPGVLRPGTLVACSLTIQNGRRQPRYAVRILGGGCWRAISLSGGADLRGCGA